MIPFGPRMNTVFASRWKALIWSAGILLTAYCSVPSRDETVAADAAAQSEAAKHAHHNPWAIDKTAPGHS
jgi:hypothetical protein